MMNLIEKWWILLKNDKFYSKSMSYYMWQYDHVIALIKTTKSVYISFSFKSLINSGKCSYNGSWSFKADFVFINDDFLIFVFFPLNLCTAYWEAGGVIWEDVLLEGCSWLEDRISLIFFLFVVSNCFLLLNNRK